jgi:hypothetical protein
MKNIIIIGIIIIVLAIGQVMGYVHIKNFISGLQQTTS